MREIVEKLYTVNELSEKAKEKAYEDWFRIADYPWSDENEYFIIEIQKKLPIKIKNWEYGFHRNDISWQWDLDWNSNLDVNMTGLRAWKWIVNNLINLCYKPKTIYPKVITTGRKKRKSKCQKVFHITGYMHDCIVDSLKFDLKMSIHDYVDYILDTWIKDSQNDFESYYSMESFIENSECNGWEFYENGEIYH